MNTQTKQCYFPATLPEWISNPPALLYASPVMGMIIILTQIISGYSTSLLIAIGRLFSKCMLTK